MTRVNVLTPQLFPILRDALHINILCRGIDVADRYIVELGIILHCSGQLETEYRRKIDAAHVFLPYGNVIIDSKCYSLSLQLVIVAVVGNTIVTEF